MGLLQGPGCWPGIADYMQKDCQTVYPHPSWQGERLGNVATAWYQREVTVPAEWAGRRIVLHAEYVHSFATVLVDGQKWASCVIRGVRWISPRCAVLGSGMC